MTMKVAVAVVAAVIVVGGFFYFKSGEVAVPQTQTQETAKTYTWKFTDTETDQYGTPHMEVSVNGRVVGTYEGSCSTIEGSSWELLPNEQSGAICWWAGGGKEIGIFDSAVKVGDLDEGSAEAPGFRGNFKTLFTL